MELSRREVLCFTHFGYCLYVLSCACLEESVILLTCAYMTCDKFSVMLTLLPMKIILISLRHTLTRSKLIIQLNYICLAFSDLCLFLWWIGTKVEHFLRHRKQTALHYTDLGSHCLHFQLMS